MMEITPDEFLDKAASLKGNVDLIIARLRDEQNDDDAHQHELQERPAVGQFGNFFRSKLFPVQNNCLETKNFRNYFRPRFRTRDIRGGATSMVNR